MFIAVQQRAEGDEQSAQAAEVAGAIEAQSPPELEDGVVPAWPHARAGIPGGETLLEKWIATEPKVFIGACGFTRSPLAVLCLF
jgi:hypothetical protein